MIMPAVCALANVTAEDTPFTTTIPIAVIWQTAKRSHHLQRSVNPVRALSEFKLELLDEANFGLGLNWKAVPAVGWQRACRGTYGSIHVNAP
jgi:hypothetical protein